MSNFSTYLEKMNVRAAFFNTKDFTTAPVLLIKVIYDYTYIRSELTINSRSGRDKTFFKG